MFAKVIVIATLAIASVAAKPGVLAAPVAPVAYSAPLVAAAAPAFAYTAGYANVGDSAVVTSHNSQLIDPSYAAYTAAAPLAYSAAAIPALAAAPYSARLAYAAPLATKFVL
ncbi:hypothetical protein RP20_CCG007132 [Aedes albopictus]|nr:hypothetical protein RP20_CCG007132 [Aedes albopictus]